MDLLTETSFCSANQTQQYLLPFSSSTARPYVPDTSIRAEAADQLMANSTIAPIDRDEAFALLGYMHPFVIPAGEVFIREGTLGYNDHALFIVRGHVLLESMLGEDSESVPVGVLGPGRWVGEITQKDDMIMRQASCSVADDEDLLCGVLTRKQLFMLVVERPRLAAKLALSIGHSVSHLLRELNQKMVSFIQINNMHQLNRAMDLAQNARYDLTGSRAAAVAAHGSTTHTAVHTAAQTGTGSAAHQSAVADAAQQSLQHQSPQYLSAYAPWPETTTYPDTMLDTTQVTVADHVA